MAPSSDKSRAVDGHSLNSHVKPALSFGDQVDLLRQRGMVVSDRTQAAGFLASVNYYHLRGYYLDVLPPGGDTFVQLFTFEQLIGRYDTDRRLRAILFAAICAVEQRVRTIVGYTLGMHLGPLGYLDPSHFRKSSHHKDFLRGLGQEMNRSREEFVKHHDRHYQGKLPFWVMVELLTLGNLSKLVKNTSKAIHQDIATQLGTPDSVLDGMLRAVTIVRNMTAHHNRLRGAKIHATCPVLKQHQCLLREAQNRPTHSGVKPTPGLTPSTVELPCTVPSGQQLGPEVDPHSIFATVLAIYHLNTGQGQREFSQDFVEWHTQATDAQHDRYGYGLVPHWTSILAAT